MSDAVTHPMQTLEAIRARCKTDRALRSALGALLFSFKEADLSPAGPSDELLTAQTLCLQLLRDSDNRRYAGATQCVRFGCDLCSFLEHVSLCADMLLGGVGSGLCFSGTPLLCAFSPTLVLSAFLNLVSNAVRFGGGDVFAVLEEQGNRAVIRVESSAAAALPKSFQAGLQCASNVCRLHDGRLLLSANDRHFCATMSLNKTLPWERPFLAPLFSQYLAERVSPVRIALCQVLP